MQSRDAEAAGTVLANAGDYDLVVAKYDPDGNLLWARTGGGRGYDTAHGIVVDAAGNVIVSGSVRGEAQLQGQHFGTARTRSVFCAKFSADGELRWVTSSRGTVAGSAHGVAVDGSGNVFLGGHARGSGGFGTHDIEVPQGEQHGLLLKFNSQGEPQWLRTLPGRPSAGVHELCADAAGRVWVAGMFRGRLETGQQEFVTTGATDSDGFVVHYDADGKQQWTRTVQGPGKDYCLGVAADGGGHVFVTGEHAADAVLFGEAVACMGSTDVYVAELDAEGQVVWRVLAGGEGADNAYTIAWDGVASLVIGGSIHPPAAFGRHQVEAAARPRLYGAKLRVR